jgi:hypothetical protein
VSEDCSSSTTIPATLIITTASIQPAALLRAVGAMFSGVVFAFGTLLHRYAFLFIGTQHRSSNPLD